MGEDSAEMTPAELAQQDSESDDGKGPASGDEKEKKDRKGGCGKKSDDEGEKSGEESAEDSGEETPVELCQQEAESDEGEGPASDDEGEKKERKGGCGKGKKDKKDDGEDSGEETPDEE